VRSFGAAACLIAAVTGQACSSRASDEELAAIRAELGEIRAEQRALREELHGRRSDAGAAPAAAAAPGATAPSQGADIPTEKEPTQPVMVDVAVDSTPPGADVFVADEKVGVTPLVFPAPTGPGDLHVRIEKAGYRPHLLNVRARAGAKISVQLAKK
jgi:hypothetical protein